MLYFVTHKFKVVVILFVIFRSFNFSQLFYCDNTQRIIKFNFNVDRNAQKLTSACHFNKNANSFSFFLVVVIIKNTMIYFQKKKKSY